MAERFERLFSLPAPAYSEGSAVLLEAGMLLRDRTSGRILVQLKLRNVSPQSIRALRVGIAAYDSFGNRLADIPEYQYTDLFVAPGRDFASDKAILLPDALTRSFAVTGIDIAFSNGDSSRAATPPRPLPVPRSLSGVMPPPAEQEFRRCTRDSARFLPDESMGLWLCPCGRWNSDSSCSNCHLGKTEAFSVPETEELLARAKARIAEEQRQKAEAEERQRKAAAAAKEKSHQKKQAAVKLSMRILAVIALLALLAAGAFFVYPRFLAPTEAAVPETPAAEQKTPEKGPSAGESLYDTQDTIRSSEIHTEDFPLKTQGRSGLKTICAGGALTAAIKTDGTVLMEGYWATPGDWTNIAAVSSGSFCAGLRNDGTVVVYGSPWGGYWNTCDSWTDIVAISAGNYHLAGLRSDGTVVADGRNHEKQCNVSDWTDIVSIVTSENCTAGLRNDGTVAVTGSFCEQSNADGWTDIVAISAGDYHLVGLRSDGTVVAVGTNSNGQCDVSDWTDIVAVSAGSYHTVGLRKDGSVVACGINNENQCNVSDWTDITEIIAAQRCTIGFHNDGTVVVAGNDYFSEANNWTNIVDIAAGDDHVVGLRSDGTLVAVGRGSYGQCNVSDWTDIRLPDAASAPVSSPAEAKTTAIHQNLSGTHKTIAATSVETAAVIREDGTVLTNRPATFGAETEEWTDIVSLYGWENTTTLGILIGLRSDGTVEMAGRGVGISRSQIEGWTDIVHVEHFLDGLLGLRKDGTVVVSSSKLSASERERIENERDIVALSGGLGIRKDGTVVVFWADHNQFSPSVWQEFESWTNIADVKGSAGLRRDGTVVVAGGNSYFGPDDVEDWTDIVAISAGTHLVGLRSDGTVVATGLNQSMQCNVDDWTDIVAIQAGSNYTLGLRSDGTVAVAGGNGYLSDVENWTDIVDIACPYIYPLGLRSDGTLISIGATYPGIDDWTGIRLPDAASAPVSGPESVSAPAPLATPTPTPLPTQKPAAFTNDYGSASTRCAYPGCTRNIVSSGDSNCCSVHSARCIYCQAYIDSDASICMDCITDAFSSAAAKGSASSGGTKSFYCMGKGDTCPNKTYSPNDFYCSSCDPNGDNREG